ncbi:MAG TPA: hypothetical protein PLM32_08805, partial [Candidatus Competibacter sp.]|nr:hypothetical protein [Candidatus Competibacter sp.]
LYPLGREGMGDEPIMLDLRFGLLGDRLQGEMVLGGPTDCLGSEGKVWLEEEISYFLERAGVRSSLDGARTSMEPVSSRLHDC